MSYDLALLRSLGKYRHRNFGIKMVKNYYCGFGCDGNCNIAILDYSEFSRFEVKEVNKKYFCSVMITLL